MTILVLLAVAAAALVAYVFAIHFVDRWPALGLALAAVVVLTAWEIPIPAAIATVAGANVFAPDVVALVLAGCAVVRLPQLRASLRGGMAYFWAALGILLLLSLMRGLVLHPLGTAINEFRPFFYFYAATSWGFSLNWGFGNTRRMLTRWAYTLGSLLILVLVLHVSLYGLGSADEFVDPVSGISQTSRPLVSGQAFVLLLCVVVVGADWRRHRGVYRLLVAAVFAGGVLLSQQRSVWASALVVLVALLLVGRRKIRRWIVIAGSFVALGLGVLAAAGIANPVREVLGGSASSSGTYDARLNSWSALLEASTQAGPVAFLIGAPFGSGFGRFEGLNRWVEFAPHNWYLTIYLRIGLIGLGCLVSIIVIGITRSARRSNTKIAIVAAFLVYGWTYSWLWYSCIFLAFALGSAGDNEGSAGRRERGRSPMHKRKVGAAS